MEYVNNELYEILLHAISFIKGAIGGCKNPRILLCNSSLQNFVSRSKICRHSQAQTGFSFTSQVKLTPENSVTYEGSLQKWFDSVANPEGVVTPDGWCSNKPAQGECQFQGQHLNRQWLLRLLDVEDHMYAYFLIWFAYHI